MSNTLRCPGCGLPTDEPRSEEFPRYHDYCLKEHYLPWPCNCCGKPIRNGSSHMKAAGLYYHAQCAKPDQGERPDLCAGCGAVVNPGEAAEHNNWAYHKSCLDKHLSRRIVSLDREMSRRSAEISALRMGHGLAEKRPVPESPSQVIDEMVQRRWAAEEKPGEPRRPDDGSDGQHYDLIIQSGHDGWLRVRCVEVVEALDLKHGVGEAFCAIWRMGKKPGEERARALRKALYYLQRELEREVKDGE